MKPFSRKKNDAAAKTFDDIAPNTEVRALTVLDVPKVDLNAVRVSEQALALIPESIAAANKMIPLYLSQDGSTLYVAMANPKNDEAIKNIGIYTGLLLEPMEAPEEIINEKIRELYATQRAFAAARELVANTEVEEENDLSNDESVPIIRFVNNMIEHAVNMKASDIHIEPHEDKLRIRFRIDGKMIIYMDTEAELGPSVSSRIKFIAGLNIAERRIPQDGRINYNYGKDQTVDMRISILPGAFGETIVIRITTALEFKLDKHSIGFNYRNLELFDRILSNTHGLILLTGPTGSGKTTTLYAALSEIDKPDINIITVEDPIEYLHTHKQSMVNQREIGADVDSFAGSLRAALREDPDVILVGEMRDFETINAAVTAAETGHLVFATIHTNDAIQTVNRIVNMYEPSDREFVRGQLASILRGTVS